MIAPEQNWAVLPEKDSLTSIWRSLDTGSLLIADPNEDWLREDENAPDYDHRLLGTLSPHNLYLNRFFLDADEVYAGLEVGITNDFHSLSLFLNNVLLFSTASHLSNHRNYFRILLPGDVLRPGSNVLLLRIDPQPHLNNVYVYGYPASPSQSTFTSAITNRLRLRSPLRPHRPLAACRGTRHYTTLRLLQRILLFCRFG